MNTEPERTLELGLHRLSLQQGIVILGVQGTVSVSEAAAMMDFVLSCDLTQPNLGMIVLPSGEFSVTPEARRYFVKSGSRARPAVPMAVVGTGTVARAILTLLINAIRITMRIDVPVGFFPSETEARAWLATQLVHRAELLAKLPS